MTALKPMAALKLEKLPCPELDPLAGFAVAGQFGRRFFWHQPSQDLTLLGVGAVAAHEGGADRAQEFISQLEFDGPAPVALGGFAFAPERHFDSSDLSGIWGGFGSGWLIVPKLLLMFQGNDAVALMAQSSAHGSGNSATECATSNDELLRQFCELAREPLPDQTVEHSLGAGTGANADANATDNFNRRAEANYLTCLKSAIATVESGAMEKVVVARSMAQPCALRPEQVLRNLMQTSPGSAKSTGGAKSSRVAKSPASVIFACGDSQRVFMGATPELLVDRHGTDITSQALAGSARPQHSEALAGDPKELAEHQLVVDYIRHKLSQAGVKLDIPAGAEGREQEGLEREGLERDKLKPEVLDLGNIVHLATQIRGTLGSHRALTAVDLAAALHPSPSVCGLPSDRARRFIADNEQLDRGWYAGPIGWMNASGDGTFYVALRSLMLDVAAQTSYCFAGSGIVKGSVAGKENQETLLKLQTAIASVEL